MNASILLVILGCAVQLPPSGDEVLVESIRNAYAANREGLGLFGMFTFRFADGELGKASVDNIDAVLKAGWNRRSVSDGLYVLDGPSRRMDHSYSIQEMVARRTMLSEESWVSNLFPYRVLTDGETTLLDRIDVKNDNKTLLHTPTLHYGTKSFFRLHEFPLDLGDPDPPDNDLGRCLKEGLVDSTLTVDDKASLDGVHVVRLQVDSPRKHRQSRYWIDLERGAIPLKIQLLENIENGHASVITQIDHEDIRWVGRGWLPFRKSIVLGSSPEQVKALYVRELVIEKADLEKRPDASLFKLEFPEAFDNPRHRIVDVDRHLSHPGRKVWDLSALSPEARARTQQIKSKEPAGSPPTMAGSQSSGSSRPALIILGGLAFLTVGALLVFWRHRRHA